MWKRIALIGLIALHLRNSANSRRKRTPTKTRASTSGQCPMTSALLGLDHALVRRSRRLDHHPAKLLIGPCRQRGGFRLCVTDIDPVATRLTPADFPHLKPYVEEMALCHEAQDKVALELAQAEYESGMHLVKVRTLRDKLTEAKCHTQQAHLMFDRMVNEMVAGVVMSEED